MVYLPILNYISHFIIYQIMNHYNTRIYMIHLIYLISFEQIEIILKENINKTINVKINFLSRLINIIILTKSNIWFGYLKSTHLNRPHIFVYFHCVSQNKSGMFTRRQWAMYFIPWTVCVCSVQTYVVYLS